MTAHECACGRPTAGAMLCDTCLKTFRHALHNTAVYWGELGTVARKQTRFSSGATKGSVGKEQPLPVDTRFVNGPAEAAHHGAQMSPGAQLRWDTWNTVSAWARTLLERLPDAHHGPACDQHCLHTSCATIRRYRRPAHLRTVPAMIRFLAKHHDWITRQTWAPAMLDELLNLEHRLARMIDRPAERWYAGRCRVPNPLNDNIECERELYATTDRGWIDCPGCGVRHDVADRRDTLLREARGMLVTATEAACALIAWTDYDGSQTKLVDRIGKWRDRGRLDVADVKSLHGKDRHQYKLGDIQELLIDAAQHQQTRRTSTGAA